MEVRYGLHPLLCKMWSHVGTRVGAPMQRRLDGDTLFGAFEMKGAGGVFHYTDRVGKEFDAEFLKRISESAAKKIHVLIEDGAGFRHKQGQSVEDKLPINVRVTILSPYSPELETVEKLWDAVKGRICNMNWKSLEDLEERLTNLLRSWWERNEGFGSLVTGSYLLTERNVTRKFGKSLLLCYAIQLDRSC